MERNCDVNHVHKETVDYVNKKKEKEENVKLTSNLFKALGNETRLKIVDLLTISEMCVCDIAVVLDMTQSSISHQLKYLKDNDIVKSRRDKSTVYYSLIDDHVMNIYLNALNHCKNC